MAKNCRQHLVARNHGVGVTRLVMIIITSYVCCQCRALQKRRVKRMRWIYLDVSLVVRCDQVLPAAIEVYKFVWGVHLRHVVSPSITMKRHLICCDCYHLASNKNISFHIQELFITKFSPYWAGRCVSLWHSAAARWDWYGQTHTLWHLITWHMVDPDLKLVYN